MVKSLTTFTASTVSIIRSPRDGAEGARFITSPKQRTVHLDIRRLVLVIEKVIIKVTSSPTFI
ncbi:hypothetical protein O9929_07730 [Vibrio lentus]|nr:hypothetical protein [Vibrio lentus]